MGDVTGDLGTLLTDLTKGVDMADYRAGVVGGDLQRILDPLKRGVAGAEQAAGIARTGLENIDLNRLLERITGAETAAGTARTGLEGIDLSNITRDIGGAETAALGARTGLEGIDLSNITRDIGSSEQAAGIASTGLEGIDLGDLFGNIGGAERAALGAKEGLEDIDLRQLLERITGATDAAGEVRTGLEGFRDTIPDPDWVFGGVDPGEGVPGEGVPGEGDPGEGVTDPEGAVPPADVNAVFGQLQTVLEELLGADPLSVSALEEDPITASLLADLKDELSMGEQDLLHEMQRLGVLRSGATVDQFERLRGDYGRTRLDVLSDAAKRADERRMGGLTRGTDLGELLSGREIDIAKLMGEFGGDQTLGGREADLGLLASMISALSPDLQIPQAVISRLIDTIFSGMGGGGFDEASVAELRRIVGNAYPGESGDPQGKHQIYGGEDITNPESRFNTFANEVLGDGQYFAFYAVGGDDAWKSYKAYNIEGKEVARYNVETGEWEKVGT